MKYIAMILIIALMIVSMGCTASQDQNLQTSDVAVCPITDFGNGVIFFGCTDILFITSLSDYIEKNNVRVNSMTTVPDSFQYNAAFGYVVIVEKR